MIRIAIFALLLIFVSGGAVLENLKQDGVSSNETLLEAQQEGIYGRIVGGTKAKDGAHPHSVSLRMKSNGQHFCGGSIVSPKAILTAAHCVKKGTKPASIVVVAGTNKLNKGGVRYGVKSIIKHKTEDMAILQLSKAISFNKKVKKIGLQKKMIGKAKGVAAGWGRTSANGKISNDLLYLNMNTITTKECKRSWNHVTDAHVCTKGVKGKGICFGDSGGPLVVNGLLTGVVSGGKACAKGVPDIFVRVSKFVGWINKYSK